MTKTRLALLTTIAAAVVAVPSTASAAPHVKVFDGRTGTAAASELRPTEQLSLNYTKITFTP